MTRIGIDARMYGEGFTGIGKHISRLLRELGKISSSGDTKHTFVVFCSAKNASEIQSFCKDFEIIPTEIRHYSLAEQIKFPSVIRKAKVDLMHFPHFNAPVLYRGKSVVTIHDLILSFYPGKSLGSWFRGKAYKYTLHTIVERATQIMTVSAYTKKDLIELMNLDDTRISVIHNGADDIFQERISPEKIDEAKLRLSIQGRYILAVGIHREHKNLGRLVEAFKLLVDEGYDGQLVLAGKEDPRTNEVREAIRQTGLKNKVVLPGVVNTTDLHALFQGAELYAMPSLYEGFGLPVLEAMAAGVPVAASKTTSLPEVGGDAAEYFHPLRVDEIAETLKLCIFDAELRKQMVARGYEQIKKFTWEKFAKETLAVYEQALNKN